MEALVDDGLPEYYFQLTPERMEKWMKALGDDVLSEDDKDYYRRMEESLAELPQPQEFSSSEDGRHPYARRFLKNMACIRDAVRLRTVYAVDFMDRKWVDYVLDLCFADRDHYLDIPYLVQSRMVMHSERLHGADMLIVRLATTENNYIEIFEDTFRARGKMEYEDLAFYLYDPPFIPVEIFAKSITGVAQPEGCCSICDDVYETAKSTARQGKKAAAGPCGHVFCKDCLDEWLLKMIGTYSCPMCRRCLVCGTGDCRVHWLPNTEDEHPLSLQGLLSMMIGELPENGHMSLDDDAEIRYFHLFREESRRLRVSLALDEKRVADLQDRQSDIQNAEDTIQKHLQELEDLIEKYQIREILKGEPLEDKDGMKLMENWSLWYSD